MYKILFPIDGSDLSSKAVKQGMALAKALKATAVGLHVIPEFHMKQDEGFMVPDPPAHKKAVEDEAKARARGVVAAVEEEARSAGVPCECTVEINDVIYEQIIDTAQKKNCDLIVMASHGRTGVAALLLASETAKVLTHSKLPVLVVR
ncbi:MAG: universal stress protein [Betaproteobacteria bacterium]|nr:universal stress protein [Betaproteobacteria bacterium]